MPLSEHEQRLLDEIEQALYAEDPKFASSVRSARRRRVRSSMLLCIAGVVVGLGLVLVGLLATIVAVSVVGFVVLVGSCGYAVQTVRHRGGSSGATPSGAGGAAAAARAPRAGSLRSRMEDRMRRRFDEN